MPTKPPMSQIPDMPLSMLMQISPSLQYLYDHITKREAEILNTVVAKYLQHKLTADEALHSIIEISTLRQLHKQLMSDN